jgi:hypothetical protein
MIPTMISRSDISSACWSVLSAPIRTSSLKTWLFASVTAGSARATTSPSIDCPAQAVLGCVANVLVRMEEASRLGHS